MPVRDDDAITGDIIAAFAASPRIHSAEIRVYTQSGKVRLQGIVENLAEKLAAEETAGHVAGVRGVENDLTISADRDMSDLDLERMVQQALNDGGMASIGARVEAGNVFLMGRVSNIAEAERAADIGRAISGVRDVLSELEIAAGEPVDDVGLADMIVDVLSDDGRLYFYNLDVVADDGRVLITGEIDTKHQLGLVTQVAQNTPGVRSVDNRMTVIGSRV